MSKFSQGGFSVCLQCSSAQSFCNNNVTVLSLRSERFGHLLFGFVSQEAVRLEIFKFACVEISVMWCIIGSLQLQVLGNARLRSELRLGSLFH